MASRNLPQSLLNFLRAQGGVATSAELQALLGVSQPTVSRTLMPLMLAGEVRQTGAARARRYLLPRHIAGAGSESPVMRVDAQGQAMPFGRLVPLPGGRFWVDEADGVSELHAGLPWFLDDMRPQGFMGSTFAQAHPGLGLGADPRRWSTDEALKALVGFGDDLPGNLIVGAPAFARFHTLGERTSQAASSGDYSRLAEQALQGVMPGAPAGGEQPKFCTLTEGRHRRAHAKPVAPYRAGRRTPALAGGLRRADCQHRPPLRQYIAAARRRRLAAVAHL